MSTDNTQPGAEPFVEPSGDVLRWAETPASPSASPEAPPRSAEPSYVENGYAEDGYERIDHGYTIDPAFANDPDTQNLAALFHNAGVEPELANWMLSADAYEDHSHRDDGDRANAAAELRALWGPNYQANVERARQYLENNFPTWATERLFRVRLPDGRALLNVPEVLVEILGMAKRAPVFTRTGNAMQDIKTVQSLMTSNRKAYFADPGVQALARDLYRRKGK